MKSFLLTSVILLFAQASLASVLDKVVDGKYKVQCLQDEQYPVTYTTASIAKNELTVMIELVGTAYEGSVNSSIPLEFSKNYTKTVKKSKASLHDNIVIPGTVEVMTTIKNSNGRSAGIQETVKIKIGFVTVSTDTSTTILSIQGGDIRVDMSDSEGEEISCILSK